MESLALDKSIIKCLRNEKQREAFISDVLGIVLCHTYRSIPMRTLISVSAISNLNVF
jgi:hypothetical protein